MVKCNLDCSNCTKTDCDVDFIDWNSVYCKRWYEKNKEEKLKYQRAYNKRKRQNKPKKKDSLIIKPKEYKLLSFLELGAILEGNNE